MQLRKEKRERPISSHPSNGKMPPLLPLNWGKTSKKAPLFAVGSRALTYKQMGILYLEENRGRLLLM